jgi:hypothetical protein
MDFTQSENKEASAKSCGCKKLGDGRSINPDFRKPLKAESFCFCGYSCTCSNKECTHDLCGQ